MNGIWVQALLGPLHLGIKTGSLYPIIYYRVKGALFQMSPIFSFLISSGYKKKEPVCACLSEAKA
jgi:hypothetical protein